MKENKILDIAIHKGREAVAEINARRFRPLSDSDINERVNTLANARSLISDLREELSRLQKENAKLKTSNQVVSASADPAQSQLTPKQALEKRYWARIAEAEKEVEKAKDAVLSAPSPAEQMMAMKSLRLAEDKLNFQKRNFQ